MNYRQYEAEDFAADASFQAWVQGIDEKAGAFWERWLLENPDRNAVVKEARELLLSLRFRQTDITPQEMETVKGNIDHVLDSAKKNETLRRRRLFYSLTAAAASVLLAAVLLFQWLSPAPRITITTAYAETKQLQLPDGTRVWLNANSSITYAQRWTARREREVELKGEAYFEVTKKPAGLHPKFRVHTGLLNVEVKGTAFNVYNRRDSITVVLEEGSIALRGQHGAGYTEMKPGEMVAGTPAAYTRRKVDPSRYIAWKQQRLLFNNEPLSAVAQVLEDNYGYEVRFADTALRARRFTGSCPAGNIGLLLAAIREVHEAGVRVQGRTIIFE
jgi:transmembrane sensor